MNVITRNERVELNVRNSRFLAESFAVTAQDEARALLKAQKEKYADASHVVHAFVIGPTGGILGCSDDGEPSGTAGRPVLEVLKGSGLTNVLVTVSRWFGGTLLGTGGLVKAYTDSAKAVLEVTPSEELVAFRNFSLVCGYDSYEKIKREMDTRRIELLAEDFGTVVAIQGRVRESDALAFVTRVTDLTLGQTSVALSEENQTGRQT